MQAKHRPLRILGLPGSLRSGSYNRRLLELAQSVAPPTIDLPIYGDMGSIPLFNEDLEGEMHAPPEAVARLRTAIAAADAVLIATPEYNQSMPGVLKNAIDWLSRPAPSSAFSGKPVALCGITTGEWGTRLSQAALRQTLFATGARLVPLHLYFRKAGSSFAAPGGDGQEQDLRAQLRTFLGAMSRELNASNDLAA